MSDTEVGKLREGNERRDAIHIAMAPVIADEILWPGQHIGFSDRDTINELVSTKTNKLLGIVDPYLSNCVYPGNKFWMFLYPRTITGLNHVWDHPDFPEKMKFVAGTVTQPSKTGMGKTMDEAIQYIDRFAKSYGMEYAEMLNAAKEYQESGEYLNHGPRFEGEYVPEEFWEHYETVTGKKVLDKGSFFSCSC